MCLCINHVHWMLSRATTANARIGSQILLNINILHWHSLHNAGSSTLCRSHSLPIWADNSLAQVRPARVYKRVGIFRAWMSWLQLATTCPTEVLYKVTKNSRRAKHVFGVQSTWISMPISSLLCNQEDQTFVAMSPHDITKYKSTEGVVYFDTHLYNMISI